MTGWRGAWAAAQITGVLFSTLVWIVVWGLSLPALAGAFVVGALAVAGRNTRSMLWWRFGAVPATDLQRDAILTAIIPIASLRGRHQPFIWLGRRIFGAQAVMPSSTLLVVSEEFVGQVARGRLTNRQTSAIVSQSLGAVEVLNSSIVNMVEAYCLPWRLMQVLIAVVIKLVAQHAELRFSWKIRWLVFGLAIVDSHLNARWTALVGVTTIAVLSWTTGHLEARWEQRYEDLRDQRAIAEGVGLDLADLIQRTDSSVATTERADRLRHGALIRANVRVSEGQGRRRLAPL